MSSSVFVEFRNRAFNRRMLTFAVVNRDHIDITEFSNDAYVHFNTEIGAVLGTHSVVKVNTCFSATFEKPIAPVTNQSENRMHVDEDDTAPEPRSEKQTLYIHSKSTIIDNHTNLHLFFNRVVIERVLRKIDEAILQGSGFTLSSINKVDPLRGSSYIHLPPKLHKKHAIINIKNKDEMCFKWSI